MRLQMTSRNTRFSVRLPGPKGETWGFVSSFLDVDFSSLRGGGSCLGGVLSSRGGGAVSFLASSCLGISSFFGSGPEAVGCSFEAGFFVGALASLPPSPVSSFAMSCPTVTVSPSLTSNSLIVPAAGALTETSILERVY